MNSSYFIRKDLLLKMILFKLELAIKVCEEPLLTELLKSINEDIKKFSTVDEIKRV